MTSIILDIETVPIEVDRLADYIATFEPDAMVAEEPEWVEVETDEKPKKGKKKPKAKKAPKTASKANRGGLHWLTGRIACVGVKELGKEPIIFIDKDESVILVGLYEYLSGKYPYNTITFNGGEFDLPFLRMRALLYGIDLAGVLPYEKFSKTHIDIYQVLGGKWQLPAKLAEYAWFFGIDDIKDSGAEVARMWEEGKLDDIANHCRGDVISTEKLYHRVFPGGKKRKY